jgi:hypothetical protein
MFKTYILLSIVLSVNLMSLAAGEDAVKKTTQFGVYYKNDIGISMVVLMDQRMSNLHYTGPGAILNFGRYALRQEYITEWSFGRFQYNSARPGHQNTKVENPGAGIRYMYLRRFNTPRSHSIYAGGQVNVFGNMRIAPRLGNSYLHADLIAEIRPQADLYFDRRFLWREWNIDLSMALSLGGYTVRVPEYGVSYELSDDGGVKLQGFENKLLTPFNYGHVTTGIFIREFFRGESNPNWLRIGYIWDYYSMRGNHSLNMNNALHQVVLEVYFMVR